MIELDTIKGKLNKNTQMNRESRFFLTLCSFTWEQRELGEVATFSKGHGYSKNDITEFGTPIILYGRLYTKYETTISEVDTFVSGAAGGVYSCGHEVIVPASGETPEDIARASAIETPNILLGGDLNIVYPDDNLSSVFLAISISNGTPQKELSRRAQGKSVVHLRNDDLKFVKICFPLRDEQTAIGTFFATLDNLITCHQRECVYSYKENTMCYMVETLDFPNTWEQRELGEVVNTFEYGLNAAAKEFDGQNKYLRITDIDDETNEFLKGDLTSPNIELTNQEKYILKKGDLLFARTGASVGKTYLYQENDGVVYYAGFLIKGNIKQEYNTDFVFQNTKTEQYKKFIQVTSQRSGQPGVNALEYASYKFNLPFLPEQTAIGTFFATLDNLITCHQRKPIKLRRKLC